MSNSENTSTPDSSAPLVLPNKTTFTQTEFRVAQVFVGIITACIFILIIGAIWAIGDLLSQDKFGIFLTLSLFSQIFISGVLIIGLFILSIFMVVIYRRGRDSVLQSLFKAKPEKTDLETYMPAKVIAAGALISIFTIFLGLLIALIQLLVEGSNPAGFFAFLGDISGGLRILIIGGFLLAFTLLGLAATYAWENGYFFVMNIILRRNQKFAPLPVEFSKGQKITGNIFFGIVVGSVILMVVGIIIAILDAVSPTGTWDEFAAYPLGIKFSIIGCFASGLFLLLIGAMTIYKWGNRIILVSLFVRLQPFEMKKDNTSAKVIAWGILIGIFLIIFSLSVWLISVWVEAFGEEVGNPFQSLAGLSPGLLIITIGLIVLIFAILINLFAYLS